MVAVRIEGQNPSRTVDEQESRQQSTAQVLGEDLARHAMTVTSD